MQLRNFILFFLSMSSCAYSFIFVRTPEEFLNIPNTENSILIASIGRSGSTLLTEVIEKSVLSERTVFKTHSLSPSKKFYQGKILFIFSDPNQSIESVLHRMLIDPQFSKDHFRHVTTADQEWFVQFGLQQTAEHNVLSYDALGYFEHLHQWLLLETNTSPQEARTLAIKYENLWDQETQEAICSFLQIDHLDIPPQETRGKFFLLDQQKEFRAAHNIGSTKAPIYPAYAPATRIWRDSPPLSYFK